jgi:long-chain acyl-CoA synthetase
MTQPRPWEAAYPTSLRNYVFDLNRMPNHPADLPAEAARSFGERAAFSVVLPSGHTTSLDFHQIEAHADALAQFFCKDLELRPGDVVAVQLPNCLHYPIATFAAWKAGLILTTVNPLYTPPEIDRQLEDSGAKALIACDLFLASSEPIATAREICLIVASLSDFFPAPLASTIRKKMEADSQTGLKLSGPGFRFMDALAIHQGAPDPGKRHDVVLYQYTGGTTGRSKAAIIKGVNVLATLRMTDDFLDGYGNGVNGATTLTVLPLYHIFAFMLGFLLHFRAGSQNVLVPSPRPLSNLKPAFELFPIDWMAGVDTLFAGLLAEPWFRQKPPRLRYTLTGGTAIRPTTAYAWEQIVSPMVEGYGLTESTCIVAANPPNAARRVGTVGVPLPGCDVKIMGEDGVEAKIKEAGELLVRGPQIVESYHGQPEDSAGAFASGWFRTGDIARMAEDGYLEIVDRKKDVILVSGFNVYPNEIEAVIAAHPEVVEVAVIGIPSHKTGEAVKAFVVTRDTDLKADDIFAHCRLNLAAYKMPKDIVFCPALPKSSVGKILRAQLRRVD